MYYKNLLCSSLFLCIGLCSSVMTGMTDRRAHFIACKNSLDKPIMVEVVPVGDAGNDVYMEGGLLRSLINPNTVGSVQTVLGYPPYKIIVRYADKISEGIATDIKSDTEIRIRLVGQKVQIGLGYAWQVVPQTAFSNIPSPKNEDKWVVSENDARYAVYAVFDGHAGRQAATYCRKITWSQEFWLNLHKHKDIQEALKDSFVEIDREICANPSIRDGSCAVVVLIDKVNRVVYTANAGDSRAILVKNGGVVAPFQEITSLMMLMRPQE